MYKNKKATSRCARTSKTPAEAAPEQVIGFDLLEWDPPPPPPPPSPPVGLGLGAWLLIGDLVAGAGACKESKAVRGVGTAVAAVISASG
jgi:hypothetical protein